MGDLLTSLIFELKEGASTMMKLSHVIGILAAIALIIFGSVFPVPEKHLFVSSSSYSQREWTDKFGDEYVGGDAYNYQMEASLKAGWVSGVLALKAITISSGVILFCLMLAAHTKCKVIEQQTALMNEIIRRLPDNNPISPVVQPTYTEQSPQQQNNY